MLTNITPPITCHFLRLHYAAITPHDDIFTPFRQFRHLRAPY